MHLEQYIELIRNNKKLILDYEVNQLWFFGSTARGEVETNDIDILVEFREPPKLLQFMNLKFDLEDLLGKPIDLHSLGSCPERFYNRIKGELLRVA